LSALTQPSPRAWASKNAAEKNKGRRPIAWLFFIYPLLNSSFSLSSHQRNGNKRLRGEEVDAIMNVAFGHTNMDFDCLGSLILIKKLFPDYRLVRSNQIHPATRHLFDFYEDYFDFLNPKDLGDEQVDNIIIVDTCMAERVAEYLKYIRNSDPRILVFDHHETGGCNILGARLEGGKVGANTTYLGKCAMEKGLSLIPEEATIALTGIYADTGKLIYENVCRDDYEVAAWLLDMGASLKLVKSFLEVIKEDEQIEVMNRLLRIKTSRIIQGHVVLLSFLDLDVNVPGLAAIVEKVMDIENPDAYFAVFSIRKPKTVLLIARSQRPSIDLHQLLHVYGGGGHHSAASAQIKNGEGPVFFEEFLSYLENSMMPAVRAGDIMSREVITTHEGQTLMEASRIMEASNHSGMPVLNGSGTLSGFIGLKDIMKGRKAGAMNAPVQAYMTKPAVSAPGTITMREVERLFFKFHIGHLPIVKDGSIVGIVSRWDYLQYQKRKDKETDAGSPVLNG
jgi:tRNA nucleotidyltransferase (CCA-adding enzyme)